MSLSVRNPDSSPYLIQTVIDNLESSQQKPPFIITPPLYRLDGGKENLMRVIQSGNLPQDKESMFWLRVKAIPSAPREKNTLQIAVSTSIKLIYRPDSLKNLDVEKESDKLSWHISGNQLNINNPTPCYINFNEISVAGKNLRMSPMHHRAKQHRLRSLRGLIPEIFNSASLATSALWARCTQNLLKWPLLCSM